MNRLVGTALLAILAGLSGPVLAYEIKNCDSTAESDIKKAADFLEANMSILVDRYTFLTEKQRQEVVRKWARLNIRCADNESTCEANVTGRAHGGPGNTINLCYYTEVRLGGSLCDLTRDIMHEQGHAHGFRMVSGHNDPTSYHYDHDPMYRMGGMAQNFCEYRADPSSPLSADQRFTDAALKGVGNRAISAGCSADLQCASSKCSQDMCVCDQNTDCPIGQECFKPIAARNYCSSTSLGLNAPCTRDDQCRSNQCEGDVCVCRHDSDCPTGRVCKTPITGSNFCEVASDPIGTTGLNGLCERDSACLSNKCESGKCVCNADSDCPTGQECYRPITGSNVCRVVGLNLGAGCQRDSQCRSDHCEDNQCVCRHDDDCPNGTVCKTPITRKNYCE